MRTFVAVQRLRGVASVLPEEIIQLSSELSSRVDAVRPPRSSLALYNDGVAVWMRTSLEALVGLVEQVVPGMPF